MFTNICNGSRHTARNNGEPLLRKWKFRSAMLLKTLKRSRLRRFAQLLAQSVLVGAVPFGAPRRSAQCQLGALGGTVPFVLFSVPLKKKSRICRFLYI